MLKTELTKLRRDWQEMHNLKATIGANLEQERVAQVEKLVAAGKGDPGFPLFAAFDDDVQRCMSGRITPEKALQRLETHVKAWEAGDPRYR